MVAGDDGKRKGDGEQLLTDRLKQLDQGVFHSNARMPKIELGASLLDRLGTKAVACDEGKDGGDSEQLLTNRLKTTEQGVFHCIARTLKIELGASLLALDRLGTKMIAGDEGKGRGDGEPLLTDRLKQLDQGYSTATLECQKRARRKPSRQTRHEGDHG